ncbi:MAG TPA: hypothetical protein VE326_12430 [Candidatus Binatia bacterium]|nr:hypothetical protein [Candidatus Binatia bacterium]
MKIRRLFHPALPVALLLLTLPAAFAAAAKDEAPSGSSLRVAVIPFVNTSDEIGATKIMEDVLKAELKKIDAKRATFLWPADVERLLGDADQLARIDKLDDKFSQFGTADSAGIAGIDSVLMVDAVLLVKISEWENHRVNVVGAGQSSATVALQFGLFNPKTRALLWTKKPREQRFAAELDASSANVNYDETGVIQRKSDNAPPRYETVAADLVRDAFKKFPRG